MELPKQLQQPEFKFIVLNKKVPIELQWQTKNNYIHTHPKLIRHKDNVGIVAGYGNLRILDIDNKDLVEEFDKKINTFTVKTGSGGRHFYIICKGVFEKNYYVLGNKDGELRVTNSQVVCPGSIHPNGNKYEVINDVEIKEITKVELYDLLEKYFNKELMISDQSRSGTEWGEVCDMIYGGYNYDEIDKEMRLLGFEKWIQSTEVYRVGTYCNALKRMKGV